MPNSSKVEERVTPTQVGPLPLDQHGQHPKIWARVGAQGGVPKRLLGGGTRNLEGLVPVPAGGPGLGHRVGEEAAPFALPAETFRLPAEALAGRLPGGAVAL